ncbi:hypothetical protein [Komagataeibacter xylinus]|uniref:hypothetical protein n=1 Tax=Komagataeibacter xylinus TaxID=28448 RepID=UPI000FDF860D|nr:hypothetical protein [Komagataeibacter xylinus]AZV39945.1 hypothetical protein CXP35_15395 [Komagataeibacter xylinus]
MSGDLKRIEPPQQLIETYTLRWQSLGPGASVAFSASDETLARSTLAGLHQASWELKEPLKQQMVEQHRVRAAIELMRITAQNFGGRGSVNVLELVEGQRAWHALRAAILAEKIKEAGEGI